MIITDFRHLAYDYVNVIDARYWFEEVFEGFEMFCLAFICISGALDIVCFADLFV